MRLTLKLRLKDKHAAELNRQARVVNLVWNYCNETQQKAARSGRRWLTWVDLANLTAGSSKLVQLNAASIQGVCIQYDNSRNRLAKPWLRFRGSKSLGWVPFQQQRVRFDGEAFVFGMKRYFPMHLRELPLGLVGSAGSFNRDRRGRWYINYPVEVPCADWAPNTCVGIDLGLKTLATLSTGASIKMPAFYRSGEAALAAAQRARKARRVRAIHAKIANRRHDFLHKASKRIASEFGFIVIGDVRPSNLSQTRLAKSVFDAGWSDFKRMLSYKAIRHGGSTLAVCERMTSQTCAECGALPPSRPRGSAGLSNRVWRCDDCGSVHDRDVNAARNILAIGLDSLKGGAARMRSSQRVHQKPKGHQSKPTCRVK